MQSNTNAPADADNLLQSPCVFNLKGINAGINPFNA